MYELYRENYVVKDHQPITLRESVGVYSLARQSQ